MHMVLKKEQYLNKQIIGLLIVLLVTMFSLGGCSQSYDEHVQMVRNGTMNMRPNVPVGEAFDQFLKMGNGNTLRQLIIQRSLNFQENARGKGKQRLQQSNSLLLAISLFNLGIQTSMAFH